MELHADSIGGGFRVFHGYSTIVFAKAIGRNFTVYQQVTVGDNAVIGAGTVVTNDVPANTTVVGAAPRYIEK